MISGVHSTLGSVNSMNSIYRSYSDNDKTHQIGWWAQAVVWHTRLFNAGCDIDINFNTFVNRLKCVGRSIRKHGSVRCTSTRACYWW